MIATLSASRFRPSCTRLLIQRRRPLIVLTRPPLRLRVRLTLSPVHFGTGIDQCLLVLDQPGARGTVVMEGEAYDVGGI